jgi:2-iminobutanoate/2-iminopropanoate deaminase
MTRAGEARRLRASPAEKETSVTTAPYSPFRRAGDLVTFSGLIGRRDGVPGTDLQEQLALIFEQLDARLAETGLERRDVVKATVWLTDMADWAAMNEVYLDYFAGVELPTRSAVGAQLMPGYVVELEAWAWAGA